MVIDIVTTEPGLSSNMLASLIVLQRKSIHLYIHTDTLFPSNALMLLTSNHTDFVMYCTDHERPVQATVGTGCEPAAVNESISWRPHTMQAATHSARPHTNTVPSRYIQLFLYSVMITVHIKHLSVWYTGLSKVMPCRAALQPPNRLCFTQCYRPPTMHQSTLLCTSGGGASKTENIPVRKHGRIPKKTQEGCLKSKSCTLVRSG